MTELLILDAYYKGDEGVPILVPLNLELEPLIDFDVGEPCVAAELQALAEQEVERLKGAGWNRADFAGALRKLLQDTPASKGGRT